MINLSNQDWQLLSTYLDRELNQREQAAMENRLQLEPDLKAALKELRQVWFVLHSQPRLRAPRNYYLTPAMVGVRKTSPAYPVFGLVSAMAAILLIVVVAGDLFKGPAAQLSFQTDMAVQMEAAPAFAPAAEMAPPLPSERSPAEAFATALQDAAASIEATLMVESLAEKAAQPPPSVEAGSSVDPIQPTPASTAVAEAREQPAPTLAVGGEALDQFAPTPTYTPTAEAAAFEMAAPPAVAQEQLPTAAALLTSPPPAELPAEQAAVLAAESAAADEAELLAEPPADLAPLSKAALPETEPAIRPVLMERLRLVYMQIFTNTSAVRLLEAVLLLLAIVAGLAAVISRKRR